MKNINVAVLGASAKPDRYSNQAVKLLSKNGYKVIPVHPSGVSVNGITTIKHLSEINVPIHTLCIYVNSSLSSSLKNEILKLSPKRIIFNPGTENGELEKICKDNNMLVEKACTLVLLKTNSFIIIKKF
jgi:predicted CoA-binding protein